MTRGARSSAVKIPGWPEVDRLCWEAALEKGNVFRDPGGGAHWAEATRRRYAFAWGRYLAWQQETSLLKPVRHLTDRIRPDLVQAYIDQRRTEIASSSVASELECLHNMALCLAPKRHWNWLSDALGRARAVAVPVRAIAPRLVPIQDLWEAAFRQIAWAETRPTGRPDRDRAHYRDGVIVGLLCATLLRLKNLAGLELGRHLRSEADGWIIAIASAEVKNRVARDVILPERLGRILDGYVDQVRPKLLHGRESRRLWISEAGRDLTAEAIHNQIKKVTNRFVGRRVGPHLFRHCAATSMAEAAPELAYMIQHFLGHSNSSTSDLHYKLTSGLRACRRLQRAIEACIDLRASDALHLNR